VANERFALMGFGRASWPLRTNMRQFAVAGLLMAAALLIRWALYEAVPGLPPFIIILPAVVLAGIFGGSLAAALATGLGALVTELFWLPGGAFTTPGLADVVNLISFCLTCVVVIGATEALRKGRDRAKTYFDVAGTMLVVIERDLTLQMINRRGLDILGYEDDSELVGHDWVEAALPLRLRDTTRLLFTAMLHDRQGRTMESQVRRRDGGERIMAWRFVVYGTGAATIMIGSGEDVTERQLAIAALERSEARSRAVLRQIPAAVAIIEAPEGRLLMASDLTADILGHEHGHLRNASDAAHFGGLHADGRRYIGGDYPIMRALRKGQVIQAEPMIYRRPDGDVRHLETYATPIFDNQGQLVAALGMGFDVTKRKRDEAALVETAHRLSLALDAGAMGLWELDRRHVVLRIDANSAAILGLNDHREISVAQALRLVRPRDRADILARFRAARQDATIFDAECASADIGGTRWFAIHGQANAQTGGMVGVLRDVTDRRQREDALHEALRSRELLFREADHRIKNSLQLVMSVLNVQRRGMRDQHAADALADAIMRVNAVAEAHRGLQASKDLRTVDFANMLRDLNERLNHLTPHIEILSDLDKGLELDAEKAIPLGLIVSELLTNALRHGFPDGREGQVTVTARQVDDVLRVDIVDNGVGIVQSEIKSGLGSTVIQALIGQVNAALEVHSVPGAGTRARIELPLAMDNP
jgi:PAS domain S-box-containing protein